MKNNTVKVVFEISANEYDKFMVLESIALTQDERVIRLLSALMDKLDIKHKRKRTAKERAQLASWMEVSIEDIAQ